MECIVVTAGASVPGDDTYHSVKVAKPLRQSGGAGKAPSFNPYAIRRKEEGMKLSGSVLWGIIGGLVLILIAAVGWEFSRLADKTDTIETNVNANHVAMITAVGNVEKTMAVTNTKLDGITQRLDQLIEETRKRK